MFDPGPHHETNAIKISGAYIQKIKSRKETSMFTTYKPNKKGG